HFVYLKLEFIQQLRVSGQAPGVVVVVAMLGCSPGLPCLSPAPSSSLTTPGSRSASTSARGLAAPSSASGGWVRTAACSLAAAAAVASAVRRRPLRRRCGRAAVSWASLVSRRAGGEAAMESLPYGEWASPITARFITAGGVKLKAVTCGPDGALRWMEGRSQEAGRQVVCLRGTGGEKLEATPAGSNARTRVHEYGGVPYLVGPGGNGVIYSDFKDQRLYWAKQVPGQSEPEVVPLTPPSAYEADKLFRFADGVVDAARNRLIYVREDHTDPGSAGVKNTICALALDGSGDMQVLAGGRDFYSAPRLSPDGQQLAYICWDHPSMPWDATELRLASLDAAGLSLSEEVVCGGGSQEVSVMQPAWSASGELHFVADSSGWWNLYQRSKEGQVRNLCPRDAEFSGAAPGWGLGEQNYALLPDGRCVGCFADRSRGASRLVILGGSESVPAEFGQEEGLPRNISELCASPDGRTLYFLGGGPDKAPGVWSWEIPEPGAKPKAATELVSSMREDMQVDPAYYSMPKLIEFPTAGGQEVAYGYYYPPTNPGFRTPEAGGTTPTAPPLLVKAHGGPTAQASVMLNHAVQFWTSRGFAVLDVDYRGSTGYGRTYRSRLRGNWGIVDIEDVCAGAEHLVKQGLADASRLAIDGGSAG
ncbi:unnamed protein product, partial [Polarella glacialis]